MKALTRKETLTLLTHNPRLLSDFHNQQGQHVKLFEHPTRGENAPVHAIINGIAFNTSFHDTDDLFEGSEYNPILLNKARTVNHENGKGYTAVSFFELEQAQKRILNEDIDALLAHKIDAELIATKRLNKRSGGTLETHFIIWRLLPDARPLVDSKHRYGCHTLIVNDENSIEWGHYDMSHNKARDYYNEQKGCDFIQQKVK